MCGSFQMKISMRHYVTMEDFRYYFSFALFISDFTFTCTLVCINIFILRVLWLQISIFFSFLCSIPILLYIFVGKRNRTWEFLECMALFSISHFSVCFSCSMSCALFSNGLCSVHVCMCETLLRIQSLTVSCGLSTWMWWKTILIAHS